MHKLNETAMTRMGELYELTSRQMRVLHEDVITRITILGEGRQRDS